ncbi:Acetate kinase [Corynebacterium camporealensis]|uniref:Acetate kinase n=1 Tax=Corynebacterium camporealensis TaxID=161896 RepID=A0A0F6QZR1_9CORY|nr:acetate kinase [Corynebacterium camporealensis]AKE39993.1 acetate kinase [Corynebacterium camporealensis]AVH89084.1 Acetate kinase [Corynebacterium camporealensis]
MSYVLVLNSGSSSVKFQLVNPESTATDVPLVSGLVEQVGEPMGAVTVKTGGEEYTEELEIPTHSFGLERAFAIMSEHNVGPTDVEVIAVGHRVVHGGRLFSEPQLITDEIEKMVEDLIPLAPLHNPANLDGIRVARELLPDIPHVGVFDTAFFNHMPPAAALYAINNEVASKYDIRRYGFHGTSHEFVSQQVPKLLDRDPGETHQITLHLGNGASAAAISNGTPIDTSMGLTPLAGLAMGTRSGDIDPGIIFHLSREAGMSIAEIDNLLNKQSGVKGLAGVNDFRILRERINDGDSDAWLAYNIYIHQLRRFIGSYMIALGRVDAITFTAGVGENDTEVRQDSLYNLDMYGIDFDKEANLVRSREPRMISTPESKVKVFVVPTNEELAIAQKSAEVAAAAKQAGLY